MGDGAPHRGGSPPYPLLVLLFPPPCVDKEGRSKGDKQTQVNTRQNKHLDRVKRQTKRPTPKNQHKNSENHQIYMHVRTLLNREAKICEKY